MHTSHAGNIQTSARDEIVVIARPEALPMRLLAAGVPLTLLLDLAEPGRSAEIALVEAAQDLRHSRRA